MMNDWNNQKETSYTKQYKCPYCENNVASLQHFSTKSDSYNFNDKAEIWICPHCKNATIFVRECVGTSNSRKYLPEKMIPNNKIGKDDIKNLPDDIKFLWEEIRNSYQANAFDGVSMLTRTLLLMICENLDKSKTINKDSSYKQCVDYLIDNGLIAIQSKKYADKLNDMLEKL